MEQKIKTKDQKKIERLEEKLAEKEAEISQLKKDRKRLNYAVERLEREKKKALNELTPAAIDLICEYSETANKKEKETEELKAIITEREKTIANREERYNLLLSQYNEKKADEDAIREKVWKDKKQFESDTVKKAVDRIVETWDGIYRRSWDDRKQQKYFNEGKRYWYYGGDEDGDFDHPIFVCSMFSTNHLIIGIHPDNGRVLSGIDQYAIQHYLQRNYDTQYTYRTAIKELEEFKNNNPNVSEEELVEWAYQKGMELLPLYRDKIF